MLVDEYLDALAHRDITRILSMFADGAVVHSPLYGSLAATEFYPRLFADTRDARLTLRGILRGDNGSNLIAFWFHFDWTLVDGTPAPFDVVDVAELDDAGSVRELHIIYDTAEIRERFGAAGLA